MLGASCAKDIVDNCRGVNLDTVRLKDCLYAQSGCAVAPVQERLRLRPSTPSRSVSRRAPPSPNCASATSINTVPASKGDRAQALACVLAGPRGMTINCNKALTEAGYR